jgi:hypothetical protein
MTSQTKFDMKKIQDAIRMLSRYDRKTQLTTKVGDNPAAVDATLTLIENLCAVIRQQEGLVVEDTIETEAGFFAVKKFLVDEDGEPVCEAPCC